MIPRLDVDTRMAAHAGTQEERLRLLEDTVWQMAEELRHALETLEPGNFSEAGLRELKEELTQL